MKRVMLISLGILIRLTSSCQSVNPSGFISLRISDDSLKFSQENMKGSISFITRNESNENLLVYGLSTGGFRNVPFEKSQLCELENVGLGIGLIIYNDAGDQLISSVTIRHRPKDRPMTKLRLDSILNEYKTSTTSDITVFKRGDEKVFIKPIDISSFELEKGTYFLQIIIYCGKQIYYSVSEERIALDRKRLKADLYQGCTFSNKVRITVE